MSQNLEQWWGQTAPGSSHSTLKFDPDGIEDLLKRLNKTFPSSPAIEAADFGAAGNVKTVQDLVDALQPVAAGVEMDVSPIDAGLGKVAAPGDRPAKRRAASRKTSAERAPKKGTRSTNKRAKSLARTVKNRKLKKGKKGRKAR
jgi:hypothetical protein